MSFDRAHARIFRRVIRLVLAACLTTVACGDDPAAPEKDTIRVLFIGNSLTGSNDLPAMLEALAAASGPPAIRVAAVTRDGFSLEDHWNESDARARIAGARWDWVVLQQGPSALPASR